MQGDLIGRPYQYEYGGLLMGSGTPYITSEWQGLFGIPELRTSDLDRHDTHGVIPGIDLMGGRRVNGTIEILEEGGPELMETRLEALQTAMIPREVEEMFVYQRPDRPKRFIMAKPRRSSFPSNYALAMGHATAAIEFFATDPRHYDLAEETSQIFLGPGATSDSVTIEVGGNYEADLLIDIDGPASEVRLTVAGQTPLRGTVYNNRTIALDPIMGASDNLALNTGNRSIRMNGVSKRGIRRNDNRWWSLLPGTNIITYSRASNNASGSSSCILRWRNTHIL